MMIKAIPTRYKGITFRSKLEANWAKYFDRLSVKWFYEPEGYYVRSQTGYLPDFYLLNLGMYAECKSWNGDGLEKVGQFVEKAKYKVLMCFPNGRFLLCCHFSWLAADVGLFEPSDTPDVLIRKDWDAIERMMKENSSLSINPHGAIFTNLGEVSDAYTGYEPEYWNSIKDTEFDGREGRTEYWGGFSTWEQRGFKP